MTTTELLNFIKAERQRGQSQEAITAILKAQGWREADIQEAFLSQNTSPIQNQSAPNPKVPLSKIGIAGVVVGSISVLASLFPIIGIPIAFAGLILGIFGLKGGQKYLGIISIGLSVFGLTISLLIFPTFWEAFNKGLEKGRNQTSQTSLVKEEDLPTTPETEDSYEIQTPSKAPTQTPTPTPTPNTNTLSQEVIFDIPALMKMTKEEVIKTLGTPDNPQDTKPGYVTFIKEPYNLALFISSTGIFDYVDVVVHQENKIPKETILKNLNLVTTSSSYKAYLVGLKSDKEGLVRYVEIYPPGEKGYTPGSAEVILSD